MALGFNLDGGGGGNFLPIVKYDARAGRMFRVDREDGNNEQVDITKAFKAVFDLSNIEVGWIMFSAGGAPAFDMHPLGSPLPPKPTPDHKNGVRLVIKLAKEIGGDVRELAGTSLSFLRGINSLHDEYLAGINANPGKLPVVVLKDTLPIISEGQGKKSTNYQPQFEIASWVTRPADLVPSPRGGGVAAANGNGASPQPAAGRPPATGSTRVEPPAAKPAPAAAAEADDFG